MENNKVEHFLFELVSPEKLIFSGQVTSVVLPSASGNLTVMAHHASLVASIILGGVRVLSSSGEKLFAVCGGIADISSSGCFLLAEKIVSVDHLSLNLLEQKILQVRASLEGKTCSEKNKKVEEFLCQLTDIDGTLMKE
ncbi:F0F1 ATP synthase subunit epsilon [Bartonella sp. CB189]|uniref:F0F1 ATP synthase subunit epsilon n=1 Tax=Bartonella sp. CB189 TaxID=3112254 RepID=UPI002F96992A